MKQIKPDNTQKDEINSALEKKIYVIADEVLDILKQLYKDNKQQLNTKVIAERMFIRDTVKNMFSDKETSSDSNINSLQQNSDGDLNKLKDITHIFLNKFSDIAPHTVRHELADLKDQFHNTNMTDDTAYRVDTVITLIKKYFDTITARNSELEEFMQQTAKLLGETESHLSTELSSHQSKYEEDRSFEKNISINMNMIKQDFNSADDNSHSGFRNLKIAVMSKIETINKNIGKKRKQDMSRLRETEKILEAMGKRIDNIKNEADEIKKKAEEIELESLRDNLTGLYNRKAYDKKIIETLADLKRYKTPASLILCDIDNFKSINDNFGHKVGDLALKKISSLFSEKLRVNDFIARYGGEEFAIIVSHTTLKDARKAGEGVRAYIDDSVFSYKKKNIALKISAGISSFRADDNIYTVFERADKALYLSKKSGKNIVRTENDVTS
jgi:diguanylate cyclase